MLLRLYIENIALIKQCEIDFFEGFNCLTGETGAGKSLVIDSINMVLGQRTSRDIIRGGCKSAFCQALFYLPESYKEEVENLGIPFSEDGNFLIERELSISGRNVCKINGRMASLSQIKDFGTLLINTHGQLDNQALLNPQSHCVFLDKFAKNEKELNDYKDAYFKYKDILHKLEKLKQNESEKEKRIDYLKYEINEIESLNLSAGEEEELIRQKKILQNAGKLMEEVSLAKSALSSTDGSEDVKGLLNSAIRALSDASGIDEGLKSVLELLENSYYQIEDAIYTLSSYAQNIDFDINELDEIEKRLDQIYRLKRKYNLDVLGILDYLKSIKQELSEIELSDEILKNLENELTSAQNELKRRAKELRDTRIEAAKILEEKICGELSSLDMPKVTFKVSFKDCPFSEKGSEEVEFLISTSLIEPVKPLNKIASGGEMSRIMLAIKSVLSDVDMVETLVFDEIDAGVSGRAAQRIAEKLNALSKKRQIICVTHLPQIAAQSDYHFLIEKTISDNDAITTVKVLSDEERIRELARIIGGKEITENTLKSAKEMLEMARTG